MIYSLKKRLLIFTACLAAWLLTPQVAFAEWAGQKDGVATLAGIGDVVGNLVGVMLRLVGLSTFIMIVVGGFKYLTAGGDPKATEAAQATITSGIIGLVLAIAAWFILLAIKSFTGADVTNFTVSF